MSTAKAGPEALVTVYFILKVGSRSIKLFDMMIAIDAS